MVGELSLYLVLSLCPELLTVCPASPLFPGPDPDCHCSWISNSSFHARIFAILLELRGWHKFSESNPLLFSLTLDRVYYGGYATAEQSPSSAPSKRNVSIHLISKHFTLIQIRGMFQVIWRKITTKTERVFLVRKPCKGYPKSEKYILFTKGIS